MFIQPLILLLTISYALSDKIPCGNKIDASFWAHDQEPNHVYIFSNNNYYLWNINDKTLLNKGNSSDKWSGLPDNLEKACSIYDPIESRNINIFIKNNKFWLYINYNFQTSKPLNELFTTTVPVGDCLTCDYIKDNLVGFTSIGKANRYLSVTAKFENDHFEEQKYESESKSRFKTAMEKAGSCQALASKLYDSYQDFVYFGQDKIAISHASKDNYLKYESLESVIDCEITLLNNINEWLLYIILVVMLLIIIIFFFVCLIKVCGKKYHEDSEGNLNQKPTLSVNST